MRNNGTRLGIAGLLAIGMASGTAFAADTDQCDQCHGADGNSSAPEVPSIAGMSDVYIADSLVAYASGDRPSVKYTPAGGSESDMVTVSKALSEADISAVAAHYAGLTYKPQEQGGDAAMIEQGKAIFAKRCDKCHTDGGSLADDDSGLLLGQGKVYLENQFAAFAAGERYMSKKMAKSFKKLSDADKAAVIEFLASGKL